MTSNQIAMAQTIELGRHNVEVETETNRHNLATESLEKESLNLAREKNQLELTLGSERNRIQEEYNKLSLALTKAQGDRRLQLEEQQNVLKQQLNDITESFNIRQADLKQQQIDLDNRIAAERVRNNQALETIQTYVAMATAGLREKELEYKYHELDTHSGLKREELNLQGIRLDTDVFFRNLDAKLTERSQDINASKVGSEINLNAERIRLLPWQVFSDYAKSLLPLAR